MDPPFESLARHLSRGVERDLLDLTGEEPGERMRYQIQAHLDGMLRNCWMHGDDTQSYIKGAAEDLERRRNDQART